MERWVKELYTWAKEIGRRAKFLEMLVKVKSSEIDLNLIFPKWTLDVLDLMLGTGPDEEAKRRWTNAVTVVRWCKGCRQAQVEYDISGRHARVLKVKHGTSVIHAKKINNH